MYKESNDKRKIMGIKYTCNVKTKICMNYVNQTCIYLFIISVFMLKSDIVHTYVFVDQINMKCILVVLSAMVILFCLIGEGK